MTTPSPEVLSTQLQRLRQTGFYDKLDAAAQLNAIPTTFFCAIASRETNCINMLGDYRDGQFHGVGIVQIDLQHDVALQARDSGSWKTDPDPLILFGAQLLNANLAAAAAALPDADADAQLKIAASGYNGGMVHAIADARRGDSDIRTTGHDYGKDVMARKAIFDVLIAAVQPH